MGPPLAEKKEATALIYQNRRLAMCSAFWLQKTICHNCGFFYSRRAVSFCYFHFYYSDGVNILVSAIGMI